MEYIKYNHYNPSGYIDFVPDATKKANIKTVIIIIAGITAIGVIVWYLNNKMNNNTVTIKKNDAEST